MPEHAGIVTGASSGIGLAIAELLAADGVGLCLVASPDDREQLEEIAVRLGAVAFAGDVGEPETAERAVALTLERYGRLDRLASNAGIAYFEHALDAPLEHFDHTMHVNVRGMYLITIAAARHMAAHGGGSIVCTASTASFLGEELQASYNASKGAVSQLARSLAVDLAPHGIRVNAVAPGWVRTRVTEELLDDEATWAKYRTRIPLDRPAEPRRDRRRRPVSAVRRGVVRHGVCRARRRRAHGRVPRERLGRRAAAHRAAAAATARSRS